MSAPYPGRRCPSCGAPADGQTAILRDEPARVCDVVLCISCHGIALVVDHDGSLARPSGRQRRLLAKDPAVRRAMFVLQAFERRN